MTQVEDRTPQASIDPRIRARRIEVQRHAGRRRLRRVVDLGLVLAVAAAFFLALRSPLLDVDEVRVSGADRTGAAAVVEASGIHQGDQLIDVSPSAAVARIAELPWVDQVDLHRGLGGTVELRVTERAPAAVVGEGDEQLVVDGEGRVLVASVDAPDVAAGLVRVAGPDPRGLAPGDWLGADARGALTLAGRLSAVAPGSIAGVSVGESLVANLTQGGDVVFGDATRLTAKLRSLETVLEHVDLACLEHLDLRAPANPVLTRRQGCS